MSSFLTPAQMFAQVGPQAAPTAAPTSQFQLPPDPNAGIDTGTVAVPTPDEEQSGQADAAPRTSLRDAEAKTRVAENTQSRADLATHDAAVHGRALESYRAREMQSALDEHQMAVAENNAKMNAIVEQGRMAGQRQAERVRTAADMAAQSDVHDFWADKSTLGKAMGLISQMLAGAANSLARQPGAPTPIDKLIATDMEKQRANMQKNQAVADREQSLLAQVYKDTGSMVAAQAAMTDAAYQKLTSAAKAMANRFGTEEAQQKYLEIEAQWQQKRAETQAKLSQWSTSTAIQNQGQWLDYQAKQQELGLRGAELSLKRMPVGFRGVQGSERIPDADKTQLAKSMGAAKTAIDIAEQIKQRSGPELVKWLGERFATEQDQAALAVEIKKAAEFGGALSESEKSFLDDLSGGTFLQRLGKQQGSKWYQDALTRLQSRIKMGVNNQLSTWDGVSVGPDSPFYVEKPQAR